MKAATIRTEHADAAAVAVAVAPDNTPEMETCIEDGAVRTTIERETTSGLQSTVDDYVVNVDVAETVAARARTFRASMDDTAGDAPRTEANGETTDTNTQTNTNTQ